MPDTILQRREPHHEDQVSEILLGNLGAKVMLVGYSGADPEQKNLGIAASSGNRSLTVQQTGGSHAAFLHSGTAASAAPSPSNSVLLVDDAGASVGHGGYLRLYASGGTNNAQLSSDADGGLVLGGTGANAGWLYPTGGVRLPNGSAAAPALSFASDTNTGLYWVSADRLGVSAGGTLVAEALTSGGAPQWLVANGTAAAPALGFSGDTNSGLYWVSADRVGVTAGGVLVAEALTSGGAAQWLVVAGTAAAPGLAFSGDPNSGISSSGADRLGLSAGGALVAEVVNVGGTFGVGIGIAPTVPLDVSRSTATYVARIAQAGTGAGAGGLQITSASTAAADAALAVEPGLGGFRVMSSGTCFIGDTANANVTLGLTVNQLANDDQILALKSSDVAHGMTTIAEADTYLSVGKLSATAGGAALNGYVATGTVTGVRIAGMAGADDTVHTTAGNGPVVLAAFKVSGTGVAGVGAGGTLVAIKNGTLCEWLVDAGGNVYYDGTTNAAAWDDYDDVALLESFRLTTSRGLDFGQRFADTIVDSARVLAETGVLTLAEDGRHFVSTKALNGLLIDAIRQLHGRLAALEGAR